MFSTNPTINYSKIQNEISTGGGFDPTPKTVIVPRRNLSASNPRDTFKGKLIKDMKSNNSASSVAYRNFREHYAMLGEYPGSFEYPAKE